MKKAVATLLFSSCFLSSVVQAQALPRIPNRLPDLRLNKTELMSISPEEVHQQEEEKQAKLQKIVEFLEKNPEVLKDHIDPQKFNMIRTHVKKKEFAKLNEFDKPKARFTRRAAEPIILQGDLSNLLELADSIEDSDSDQNLKSVYAKAFKLIDPERRKIFKDPTFVQNLNSKEAKLHLAQLLKFVGSGVFKPIEVTSPGWTYSCDDEIGQQYVGAGDAADRCQNSEFHSKSLFKNSSTSDFPLKYYHTCIKNQASRGTCVSFAINAAVESLLMLKENKAYNLSEQFTYFYGEIYSDHGGRYNYGLNTGDALKKMDSKNVRFQYEQFWEYNPSNSIDDKSGNIYPQSCVGYSGEMCTNFAFQSQESISGIWPFQKFTYTVPNRGTSKNIQIVDRTNIMMWWDTSGSLDLAIALTKAKVPLIMSFNVKQNFMDTDDSGYVYFESGEDDVGGHASVILGFIPNSKLPTGVAPAKEKGFFIVKNSWGTGNGDCGYYYMDYKYVRKFVKGIYSVEIN
ncbi:MAG: hypothetical protein Fur0010_26310 [Bdellovibrio sp.]